MHPYLVDWFRNVHIHSDPKVVEKRWNTAKEYGKTLSRSSVLSLLRLFLFSSVEAAQGKLFTDQLLLLDTEFPVTKNTEELRLMAGVVMLTAFAEPSMAGDAFALGLRSASFPARKMEPAQVAILAEAEGYLKAEAERLRPNDFQVPEKVDGAKLDQEYKAIAEADTDAADLAAAEEAYHAAIADAINERSEPLFEQIRRLAEESALLWWILGEYSTSLKTRTSELTSSEYAFVAGAEAADRTHILPPPCSARALVVRALKACKEKPKKIFKLADFLAATDLNWSRELLGKVESIDCYDLVPLVAVLAKRKEFGDDDAAIKVLPRLCPGLSIEGPLVSADVAIQFYSEMVFLRALAALGKS
jgi:hypothetical protein